MLFGVELAGNALVADELLMVVPLLPLVHDVPVPVLGLIVADWGALAVAPRAS